MSDFLKIRYYLIFIAYHLWDIAVILIINQFNSK